MNLKIDRTMALSFIPGTEQTITAYEGAKK
jgi:hypothetical protein